MIDWQIKKIISVLFAVLIGAGIVFFAWKSGRVSPEGNSSLDNTNWADSLSVVPLAASSNTLGGAGANITIDTSGATTTTDVIAQRLLAEYMRSQAGAATSTISNEEATRIANVLAQQVTAPREKQYKLSDINISSDNSRDANIMYINKINALTKGPLTTGADELTLMLSVMKTGDATALNELTAKASTYQNLIKDLLAVKTPSAASQIHLNLVQAFETLRSSIPGLVSSASDPATGGAALSQYKNGIDALIIVRNEYQNYFANY